MFRQYQSGFVAIAVVLAALALPEIAHLRQAMSWRMSMHVSKGATARRGRPRKFSRPSKAVTLTLPEDVIVALRNIDGDLSRAVVRAIEPLLPAMSRPRAEVTTYGDRAVIVLSNGGSIKERTGADLVPLSDGRFLVSLGDRLSVPQFELLLIDALNDPAMETEDRMLFEELTNILRNARRAGDVQLREHSIIVLHKTATV